MGFGYLLAGFCDGDFGETSQRRRMTPADLQAICDSINGKYGRADNPSSHVCLGGTTQTLWRKLNGKSSVTQAGELAIPQAVTLLNRPRTPLLAEKWRKSECTPVSRIAVSNAEDRT